VFLRACGKVCMRENVICSVWLFRDAMRVIVACGSPLVLLPSRPCGLSINPPRTPPSLFTKTGIDELFVPVREPPSYNASHIDLS
jgi:hypothetical protein